MCQIPATTLIQSSVGWEVCGHGRLYLTFCCIRALGGGAGEGAVGAAGQEFCRQWISGWERLKCVCYCRACKVQGRGGPPRIEALALLSRFLHKERPSA